MSSSSVGATGSSKPRKGRCHLPPDEMTHRRSRRVEPSFRPQYGENRRSPHFRKDASPIKFNNINDRHPKRFTKLGRLLASSGYHNSNYHRSLCPKETDHPAAQSPARASLTASARVHFCTSLFLRDEETFCSWGRCRRSKST